MQYRQAPNLAPTQPLALTPSRAAFLKKVYALFTASVVCSAVGAIFALTAGADASQLRVGDTVVPPLVAYFAKHWYVGLILMFGSIFGASAVRYRPGINMVALLGMATIMGVVIAPSIFFAQLAADTGMTISAAPIRDAFLLAVGGFGGLTIYAVASGKDFSFMGGALNMGLWVVIGAVVLNLFLGSSVLGLAIASACVLLFGGYILYDTSRLLRSGENDAVGFAISLYINFLNLFLALLRILSARRG